MQGGAPEAERHMRSSVHKKTVVLCSLGRVFACSVIDLGLGVKTVPFPLCPTRLVLSRAWAPQILELENLPR